MDTLAPPLQALLQIKLKIRIGLSARESIREYVKESINCEFAQKIENWLFQFESQKDTDSDVSPFQTPHQKMLIETLTRGLNGDEILQSLDILETEMLEFSQLELDKQLKTLPLKIMIPLLFLQLPAFLLLLFGPFFIKMLNNLMH